MEVDGERRLATTPEHLWDLLFDPEVIRAALPSIEHLEPVSEDAYEMTIYVEERRFWGRFRGLAHVRDARPPHSYRLRMSGAAAEGSAVAQGSVTLTPDGDETILHYRGDITVHDALTRLGGRFVGGVIRILMTRFFEGLEREVAARTATDASANG